MADIAGSVGLEVPDPSNDTWIATCCLVRVPPLGTFNTKDLTDFANHEGLELLS
jgi:toxin FitB